jgi:hypothetical protein
MTPVGEMIGSIMPRGGNANRRSAGPDLHAPGAARPHRPVTAPAAGTLRPVDVPVDQIVAVGENVGSVSPGTRWSGC